MQANSNEVINLINLLCTALENGTQTLFFLKDDSNQQLIQFLLIENNLQSNASFKTISKFKSTILEFSYNFASVEVYKRNELPTPVAGLKYNFTYNINTLSYRDESRSWKQIKLKQIERLGNSPKAGHLCVTNDLMFCIIEGDLEVLVFSIIFLQNYVQLFEEPPITILESNHMGCIRIASREFEEKTLLAILSANQSLRLFLCYRNPPSLIDPRAMPRKGGNSNRNNHQATHENLIYQYVSSVRVPQCFDILWAGEVLLTAHHKRKKPLLFRWNFLVNNQLASNNNSRTYKLIHYGFLSFNNQVPELKFWWMAGSHIGIADSYFPTNIFMYDLEVPDENPIIFKN